VVLDTNALFLPFRGGFALDREIERILPGAELILPGAVLAEVDRLAARGVRLASAAREWARQFRVVPTRGRGDQAVVEAAVRERAFVVTADRALTQLLLDRGVFVLTPRDRTRLHWAAVRPRPSTSPGARRRRPAATVKKRSRLESS
jgi:hypothetical protein